LVSILLPTLGRAKELTKQTMCRSNLGGIYRAWSLYTSESDDHPPVLPDITMTPYGSFADYRMALTMANQCRAKDTNGNLMLGEGAQQNLCLLVQIGAMNWEMFLCPSTGNSPADRSGGRTYGLGETITGGGSKSYIDYGVQVPYSVSSSAEDPGWNIAPVTISTDPEVVIMGDQAPDGDLQRQWSANHPDDGEAVLHFGGNVDFLKLPNAQGIKNIGGWGNNNIYTRDEWDVDEHGNPILTAIGTENKIGASGSQRPTGSRNDTVLYSWK